MDLINKIIDKSTPFRNKVVCENCNILCSREQGWHWLLKKEAISLATLFDITTIDGVPFFSGGQCAHLVGNSCSIYFQRPMECRLSPLSFYIVDSEPSWIIDSRCPYFQTHIESNSFKQEVLSFITKIEESIDDITRNEFIHIAYTVSKHFQVNTYEFIKQIA